MDLNARRLLYLAIISILLSGVVFCQADKDDKKTVKMTVDEIVSKHLASIGTPEARAAAKSLVLVGTGTLTSRTGFAGRLGGPLQFASQGDMLLLAMVFNSNDYPYEKVGFNGKDLTTGNYAEGGSILAIFLKSNKTVVKQGLFGGILRLSWPLTKLDKDVKLEYSGIVKEGDRSLYKLKFLSPGIGDLSVSLYFDSESFRHVRSEYYYASSELIGPNPNRIPVIGSAPSRYTLIETFSKFTKVGDLTLPLSYTIDYASAGAEKSLIWTLNFSQAFYNEQLEPTVFKVS